MEKAKPGAKIRTNSASSSLPQNFVQNSSLTAVSSSSQAGQTTQLAQMPPSVLPPASATALGTQNLRIVSDQLFIPIIECILFIFYFIYFQCSLFHEWRTHIYVTINGTCYAEYGLLAQHAG